MHDNASFLTMLEQSSVIARLILELREGWREFRHDPRLYIRNALKRDAQGKRRNDLLRIGLSIGVLVYALAFAAILVGWLLAHARAVSSVQPPEFVIRVPFVFAKPDASAEDDGTGGGGGGGGNQSQQPASKGDPVEFLEAPVVSPTPTPPLKPPVLPFIEAVKGDPEVRLKRDDLGVTGLPDGVTGPPSPGPGFDGGIGTGSHGGIGTDDGPGIGPGTGGGIDGGPFGPGRRGRPVTQPPVDSRPVLLNEPRPLFTEEARKNKVQGVVRVRVYIDENGSVKEVVVTRGLPDGLSEQAIRAAYQMRFRPAMRGGRPVAYWLSNVEIEFNLR